MLLETRVSTFEKGVTICFGENEYDRDKEQSALKAQHLSALFTIMQYIEVCIRDRMEGDIDNVSAADLLNVFSKAHHKYSTHHLFGDFQSELLPPRRRQLSMDALPLILERPISDSWWQQHLHEVILFKQGYKRNTAFHGYSPLQGDVIEHISFNSPLTVKFKKMTIGLLVVAAIAGGEVDMPLVKISTPGLADVIVKLHKQFIDVPEANKLLEMENMEVQIDENGIHVVSSLR
jgi:hypothetical protein